MKRVIAHPSFKNFDYHETERYLRTLPPGDAVIRPSSKGNNKLTISWKIAEGIHDHVEVVEQDKENVFSLGQKLVINDEVRRHFLDASAVFIILQCFKGMSCDSFRS